MQSPSVWQSIRDLHESHVAMEIRATFDIAGCLIFRWPFSERAHGLGNKLMLMSSFAFTGLRPAGSRPVSRLHTPEKMLSSRAASLVLFKS